MWLYFTTPDCHPNQRTDESVTSNLISARNRPENWVVLVGGPTLVILESLAGHYLCIFVKMR